jgi:hypothetical protein
MLRVRLSTTQIEVVSQAIARLPVSDREPALRALARRLPPKASPDDHRLLAALNEALEQETSGIYDGQGLVPKIRVTMSAGEASDVYMRLLAADCVP